MTHLYVESRTHAFPSMVHSFVFPHTIHVPESHLLGPYIPAFTQELPSQHWEGLQQASEVSAGVGLHERGVRHWVVLVHACPTVFLQS